MLISNNLFYCPEYLCTAFKWGGKWTATACMAYSSAILSEISSILGKEAEAAYYKELSRQTSEFLMDKDWRVKEEFQTAYVLPLYYQMLSEEHRQAI